MAWSHRGGTSQPVYLTKEDIILTVITGNNFLFHIYYYQVSLVFSLLYFNMRYLNFISMTPHMTSNILTTLLVFIQMCLAYIVQNFDVASKSKGFLQLSRELILEVITSRTA